MKEAVVFHGTLDLEEARRLAAAVVARQGRGFQYRSGPVDPAVGQCLYVTRPYAQANWVKVPRPDGDPEQDLRAWDAPREGRLDTPCIVGAIFDERGDTWHHDQAYEYVGVGGMQAEKAEEVTFTNGKLLMTTQAENYLACMQSLQDAGSSWGAAFDAAENDLRKAEV